MKKLICLLVLLSVVVTMIIAQPVVLKCATCGRAIDKSKHYLEYDGKAYCSEACFEAALPKCATCGKVVGNGKTSGEYMKHKGKIYCSQACFEAALPKCATCGKPVNGGMVVDGKSYCDSQCFEQSLPRCAVCGKPVNGGLRSELEPDKVYCSQECFNTTLPTCDLCGAHMRTWRTLDGKKYCEACAKLPRCADCGHPGADVHLSDGRLLCTACSTAAVFDTLQARDLWQQVRDGITATLGLSTAHPIAFHLVDLDQLKRAAKATHSSERGFYRYSGLMQDSGGAWRTLRETFDIYILTGLRPAEFRDVAAHELAHDIQQRLYPKLKDKVLKEGFAEYVASLMETAWGNEALNHERLQNEFKDYVAGYQKMLKAAQPEGLESVLAYLKKQNRAAR